MDCPHCQEIKECPVLYEDDKIVILIPMKTLSKGHLRVIPKEHKTSFQEYDDNYVEHMFYGASFAATALFENLQAQGTNIIANTGGELKNDTHFHIDVLARWSDDGLNFLWTPNRQSEDELKTVQNKIRDKADLIGVKKKSSELIDLDKGPEKLENNDSTTENETKLEDKETKLKNEKTGEKENTTNSSSEKEINKETKSEEVKEENYLIRQLRRIP